MCNPFLSLCGLNDGAFSSILILAPTESEILDADKKLKRLMEEWRKQKLSITLKAHIF
jgi:hypothetical protein